MLQLAVFRVRLCSDGAVMTSWKPAALVFLLARAAQLGRANRELELRNLQLHCTTEAKSRFVANLSHELRTPLNAVIGFSELMHDGRTGRVSDTQREQLGIIRSSADHLLTLINEALDLAQVEAGHIRLDPQPLKPAAIAAECVSSLRWIAAEEGIRIELEPSTAGFVMLDPARLRQVILNYLSNAIKFTGERGTVRVRLAAQAGRLTLEVSDTGAGIAPEHHARVFEAFMQVSEHRHGGTGLGLAVTKLIVEAQGGRVGFRSRLGEGSVFYAWLPAVACEPPPEPRTGGLPAFRDRTLVSR